MNSTSSPGDGVTPGAARLRELLVAGGIHHDVGGATKSAVLQGLVARLPFAAEADRARFLRAVEAREALGATGIGEGIAIPHAAPGGAPVERPFLAIALLPKPIEWASIDQKPVHTVVLASGGDARTHLRILARLGYVLRDGVLRGMLRARAAADAILDRIDELERSKP